MAAVLKTARGGDTPPGFESLALRNTPPKGRFANIDAPPNQLPSSMSKCHRISQTPTLAGGSWAEFEDGLRRSLLRGGRPYPPQRRFSSRTGRRQGLRVAYAMALRP